jgi:hypothetical protein
LTILNQICDEDKLNAYKGTKMRALTVMLASSLSITPAFADCNSSITEYNSAISDIGLTMKRYTSCLNASNGNDQCSFEFRRLKSSQDSFESSVDNITVYCRR